MTTELPQRSVCPGYLVGGRYELVEPVASGGMAQVWRGLDRVLSRRVAVKILHPHLAGDRAFLLRFRREAIAAARLSHPSVVSIYDTVSMDGLEAIVMEYVEGRTLRDVLDQSGPLTLADARELGMQVADALAAAHQNGVVHRDIKPSNILLCGDRRVMVTDFGIAKAGEDTDLTVTGTLLGTAKYLSPEQVLGEAADPRSDLYSLGVVLYEAIAGRPPFRGETDAATALVRLHEDAPPLRAVRPEVPEAFAALVHRLLERDPNDRFQRAMELRAALSVPVIDSTIVDRTAIVPGRPPPPVAVQHGSSSSADQAVADGMDPPRTMPEEPEDEGEDDGGRLVRSWLLPSVSMVLLGAGLVVAGLLFSRSPLGLPGVGAERSDTTTLTNLEVVEAPVVAGVTSYDPQGDGAENEALAPAAVDGNEDTAWRSETYRQAEFGGLKDGVGLLVEFRSLSELSELELSTTSTDWSLEVYATAERGEGDPSSWGTPVGRAAYEGDDEVTIELSVPEGDAGPVVGRFVLLWITDHGLSSGSDAAVEHRFELNEVEFS